MARPDLEIRVIRKCRHDEMHPHATTGVGGWCSDGDFAAPTEAELVTLFFDTLTTDDPRVERDVAMVQAPSLVAKLKGLVR